MWQTVIKQRFGYLRCIIILSAVVLTLNLVIVLGECLSFSFRLRVTVSSSNEYLRRAFLRSYDCHVDFILGEDSLMYMYLQKQFSWKLENYTLFNAYATLLSGV